MSTAAVTVGLRPQRRLGPALRGVRVPLGSLALSTIVHAGMAALVVAAAVLWPAPKTKTYVVNLVPAVAAIGTPQARPKADDKPRTLTPRREEPPAPPRELPAREKLPTRDARRELPPASRDLAALPNRPLPTRSATLPRAGDKELPALPRVAAAKPAPEPVKEAAVPPPPPPPPASAPGQVTGAAHGAGTVTLTASDFPFAWYIQRVHAKIQERWEGRAIQGRQPEVIFEIARNGQLKRIGLGRSSGNPAYDQLAMRAIAEANPFPPLPDGFGKSVLTIGLQFVYDSSTR